MHRSTTQLLTVLLATLSGPGPGSAWADPPDDQEGASQAVHFALSRTEALPGSIVEVTMEVRGAAPLSLVATSVEFDPLVLSLVEVRLSEEVVTLLAASPAAESELTWIASDLEGWLQASLVFDFGGREESTLPAGRLPVFVLRFLVSETAAPGEAVLTFSRAESARFRSHFEAADGPVYNSARRAGKPFGPRDKFEDRIDAKLQDGAILILPLIGDVGIFLRGDANIDRALDVSDPIHIVTHLFLGTDDGLACQDSADANDDGRLDISDPIAVLIFLFIGVEAPSLSSRAPAADATADALTCERY